MPKNPLYLMYIDGASSPNPGPAGIGVIIYRGGKRIDAISEGIGRATNNIAEYKSLLRGLLYAKENNFKNIRIYCDSLLIIKQIKGEYRVRDANLRTLHKNTIELLKGFPKWEIEYISSKENKEVNKLAQCAAKEQNG